MCCNHECMARRVITRTTCSMFLWALAVLLLAMLVARSAHAQEDSPYPGGLLATDDGVVTGFSGSVERAGKAFIDTTGVSVRILELGKSGRLNGALHQPPVKLEVPADQVGQVFGIAIDRMFPANAYVAATSAYGLHIVLPDADGDGVPEILKRGRAGAQWMPGQWGPGGGPGSIWKIDGATGLISLLVDLPTGPAGLGQIAFDPLHYQLFVSDLDTGLIHRIDLNGNVIDTWDHGRTGRLSAGLEAVADDGVSADITSAAFDVENPNTWGFTDVRRRVWGLAVHNGRLYYAVAAGPQVFSVSIDPLTGALGTDARLEIREVPGGMEVSDILFDDKGRMYLAQRGTPLNTLDFTTFHTTGANKVLRYHRHPETGEWVQTPPDGPRQYAIGFPRPHENAAGGISLSCRGLLWSTGDNLRNDPVILAVGPHEVHGLQGSPVRLVMPRNTPPRQATFVDYDGLPGGMNELGHVGDVELYRDCVGWPAPPVWTPPAGYGPPWKEAFPVPYKRGLACMKDAQSGDWLCDYEIRVVNWGGAAYTGPLVLWDIPATGVSFEALLEGSVGFTCTQPDGPGGRIRCETRAQLNFDLFAAAWLKLRTRIPTKVVADIGLDAFRNCVAIDEEGRVRDCSVVYPPEPRLDVDKTLLWCDRDDHGDTTCHYLLTLTNNGGGAYTGKPTLTDTPGPGVTLVGDADGIGPDGVTPLSWTCTQGGGAGTAISCTADSTVTIDPTESVDVEVITTIPAGSPPEAYKNCALVNEHGKSASCVDETPQVVLEKTAGSCKRDHADLICTYDIVFTNLGPAPWNGVVNIVDNVGPNVTYVAPPAGSTAWNCSQAGGASAPISCQTAAAQTLPASGSVTLTLTTRIPGGSPADAYENCAMPVLEEGGEGEESLKACAKVDPDTFYLDPVKTPKACERTEGGLLCSFRLEIHNDYPTPFSGMTEMVDHVGPKVVLIPDPTISGPWKCEQGGEGRPIKCKTTSPIGVPPGGRSGLDVKVFIPDGSPEESYKDCLEGASHEYGGTFRDCREVPMPTYRLKTEKTPGECEWEGSTLVCKWTVTITNTGTANYTGQLQIEDVLTDPAGTPASVNASSAGGPSWACASQSGSVRCLSAFTTLAAGGSVSVTVETLIPRAELKEQKTLTNCAIGGRPQPPAFRGRKAQGKNTRKLGTEPLTPEPGDGANLCARIRLAEGQSCHCATREVPPVQVPRCPPGWKDFTGARPPKGWETKTVGEGRQRRLCARPRLRADVPPPTPGIVTPPPAPRSHCRRGEVEIRLAQVRDYQRKGYRVRKVVRQGRTYWCAGKKEVRPACPRGTRTFATSRVVPDDWRIVRRLRDGRVCAVRIDRPTCPPGWKKISLPELPRLRELGWRLERLARGFWCGKEPIDLRCPRGWQKVSPGELPRLRELGWRLRRIARGFWCGKRPIGVVCKGGEVVKGRCLCPRGTRPRLERSTATKKVYRCVPAILCPKGWKPVSAKQARALRRQGWRVRNIRGQWCAIPPVELLVVCKGGQRIGNRCVCPRGQRPKLVGATRSKKVFHCVRETRCKPGQVLRNGECVSIIKPQRCPKGMVRKGARCVRIPPRCKPGYRPAGNRCLPIRVPRRPQPDVKKPERSTCPKGTVPTSRGCMPVRVKPRIPRQQSDQRQKPPRLH